MNLTITYPVTGPRATALGRALAVYNARNPLMTAEQLVQRMVDGQLDSLVSSYVKTKVTKLEFLERFTAEERVAIREAGKTNGVVNDYLELLKALTSDVDLTSDRTTSGVQALEAAGLIAPGRAAQVLEALAL